MNDSFYMSIAINLAKKGSGYVNPNPMVGAVIVKNNRIIAQGYHPAYGESHAERIALQNCQESPSGATLYVTLEPCCHVGKTPPCTEAIIESGISRVVIGMPDPNPLVSGKGIQILKKHHIEVTVGILEKECSDLNKFFRKFIQTRRPYVIMKYAMTMDGKIATHAHLSKWISGESSRKKVHALRHAVASIMVGVNTIIHDDPQLTCRLENTKNPIRIICDTQLNTPISSQVVQTANAVPTYLATASNDEEKKKIYRQYGCHFIHPKIKENHLDLNDLMVQLGTMNIDSVLLEGGGTLNWSALEQQVVDEVHTYISPKIFGGIAPTPIQGNGVYFPDDAIQLKPYQVTTIGRDYLIKSEVIYHCLQDL